MEREVRAALALGSDEAVRAELERLAARPYFGNFTWLWAPALAKRNRVVFRPFILAAFDREALDGNGESFDPWKGRAAGALQALLDEVDAADDVELTRRLYTWKLEHQPDRGPGWSEDVVRRFRAAATAAARHTALAKVDPGAWPGIDPAAAVALWRIDRAAARRFILAHLPWRTERAAWQALLDESRGVDPEFHFELYRKVVDEKSWRDDVLALARTPEVSAELERRHPALWTLSPAGVFHALLDKHGEAAVPYVRRHVGSVAPRQGLLGAEDKLIALAAKRGWLELWAALLRTSATHERFNAEIRALVRAGDRARLVLIPGRGREAHGPGWSVGRTQLLTDEAACALYAAFPALVRGPYRLHVTPWWRESFPGLARAAIAAGDDDLVDYLASRVAANPQGGPSHAAAVDVLAVHYERLAEAAFVTRAARALSRIPAFGIWHYPALVEKNRLARLLFEHSTARYLADGAAVRDLLESSQIHVQLLGFRILGQDDPRAAPIAAAHVDLLAATLLRRMRPGSRRLAFAALRSAARHDEATARALLGRMRDALALPDRRYPVEDLVGLIGGVLQRWPGLRAPREQPVIYGEGAA